MDNIVINTKPTNKIENEGGLVALSHDVSNNKSELLNGLPTKKIFTKMDIMSLHKSSYIIRNIYKG